MSTASYIRNTSQLHIFHCEWQDGAKVHSYDFKFTGDALEGLIRCYDTVIWSKHPTFRITALRSEQA